MDSTVEQTTTQWSGNFFDIFLSREGLGNFMLRLLAAIVMVGFLIIVSKFFAKFVTKRLRENSIWNDEYTKKISGLVGEIIFYTLFVLSLLIGFSIVGIDFGWILGWISFGIWFAFKDVLGNMFAGIMVLTNKEFKLGDIIVVDDEKEYFGRVEEITIRYTVVRTFDLRKVIIPNLTLITKPVRTYDTEDVIRLETVFTVHYGTDLHQATQIIIEAVNALDFVKEKSSTKVNVQKFNESGVDLQVYFYFDPKWGKIIPVVTSEVHTVIMTALRTHNIVIPYPHTTLTVDYNDKNLLGSMVYVAKEAQKAHSAKSETSLTPNAGVKKAEK